MRRLLFLGLLVCLAAPTAALALRRAPEDGTLVVRNGDGALRLEGPTAVIGRLQGGQLDVLSPDFADCADLTVLGADRRRSRGEDTMRCVFTERPFRGTPQALRFRLILEEGDSLTIRRGSGIFISAVGQGRGQIQGDGGRDGFYSLNGEPFESLPDEPLTFTLAATLR